MSREMSKTMGQSFGKGIDSDKMKELLKGIIICGLGFMVGRGTIEGVSPMLVAYYGATYEYKKLRPFTFLAVILGMTSSLSVFGIIKYFSVLLFISVLGNLAEHFVKKQWMGFMPVVGFVATFVVGVFYQIYSNQNFSQIFMLVLEAMFVFFLTILYKKGIKMMVSTEKEEMTKEIFLSIAVLACSATVGLLNLQIIQFSILEVAALNLLLYVGFLYGLEASSVIGIAIGFAVMYTGKETMANGFIIWAILGIASGIFREIGKVGCIVAYGLIYLMLILNYLPGGLNLQSIEILIVTVGIFLTIPINKMDREEVVEGVPEGVLLNDNTVALKLKRFAATYDNIAKSFASGKNNRDRLTNQEINQLIDQVAGKVCQSCSMCNMCWNKDFYNTYKTVYSVLSAVENRGEVVSQDIPKEFLDHCLKVDEFVITINRLFDIFKTNLKWENRIMEQRDLFAQQFNHISEIVTNLSNQLTSSKMEHEVLIKKLEKELVKGGLKYQNIHIECTMDRDEVVIEVTDDVEQDYVKELLKVLTKVAGPKYQIKEVAIDPAAHIKRCSFMEKENFKFVKGYAKINKNAQSVSGDSFTFLDLPSGMDIVALSDGMGSGEKALVESKTAIEMLEQLMEGGFDLEVAIKTINTVLGVRNDHQAFATLDMSIMNRVTGECRFVKNAAVTTYIKRGDKVEAINTDTLPLGMFVETQTSIIKRKLKADDIVVMISDGISEVNRSEAQKEQWLDEAILNIDSLNPQKIADTLLEMAKDRSGGLAADDMTVLVYRVWERSAS